MNFDLKRISKVRRKFLPLLLTAAMVVSLTPALTVPAYAESYLWDGTPADGFAGGTGEEGDPYEIATGEQLAYLAEQVNAGTDYSGDYFELTDDILLNTWMDDDEDGSVDENELSSIYGVGEDAVPWIPIGTESTPFSGSFDGGGYTITGLYIDGEGRNTGLFGYTDSAQISGVGLKNVYITGYENERAGGLVGYAVDTLVSGCYTTGTVYGYDNAGGLVGRSDDSVVEYSWSTADVSGSYGIGGLVGENGIGGIVRNSYATGDVTGDDRRTGGLVGSNYVEGEHGAIVNCYASGTVTGDYYVGGLVGSNDHTSTGISNSYYYSQAGSDSSDQDEGMGFPLTRGRLMDSDSFSTWDFDTIWDIDEGESSPYLRDNEQTPHPVPIAATPFNDGADVVSVSRTYVDDTAISLNFRATEPCSAYYLVLDESVDEPSSAEIVSEGTSITFTEEDYNDDTGYYEVSEPVLISDLAPETLYYAYILAYDEGTGNYSSIAYTSFDATPDVVTPISIPFNQELTFSAANTEVEDEYYRTFKYSFTLTEETTLLFYGQDDGGWSARFSLSDADDGDMQDPIFSYWSSFTYTLPAGEYVLWINDDGYDIGAGYGVYTAQVWIGVPAPPAPSAITIPFTEELIFSPESGAFDYDGDFAYWYTFELEDEEDIEFWSDNGGVHFYVFEGNVDIFDEGSADSAYINDSHDMTLFLEAGAYTVVAYDCDYVGTAEVHIGPAPVTWADEETWSPDALDPGDTRYDAYTEEPGTDAANPILVKTVPEFAGLFWSNYYDGDFLTGKYVKLAPNNGELDFSAYEWVAVPYLVGDDSSAEYDDATAVHIDGNGTVLSGLAITKNPDSWPGPIPTQWGTMGAKVYGLFGMVVNAEIENITFESPGIALSNRDYGDFTTVGTLAGVAGSAKLRNITVEDPDIALEAVKDYTVALGGIAGYIYNNARIVDGKVTGGTVGIAGTDGSYYYEDSLFYAGGIVGASYNATIINAWADTAVTITDDRETHWYGKEAYAGGIAGYSSLTEPIYATCILNSFSMGPVAVIQTGEADESWVYAGGLAGYMSDSAVNNYSRSVVTADSSEGDVYSGQLFGCFWEDTAYTGDEGEYLLEGNYYTGDGPIGYDDTSSFDPNDGCVEINDAETLVSLLTAGREDAAEAVVYHNSDYSMESALAKVARWIIDENINDGWPVFGQPEVTGVDVVDGVEGWGSIGTPIVGQVLLANILTNAGTIGGYPVNENAVYTWYYEDSTDTILGIEPYYTVTEDNLGRVICVDVSVDEYEGTASWTAYGPVVYTVYNLTAIAGTGGSISGSANGTYGEGAEISVTATANSHYRFDRWTAEGVTLARNKANPAVFNMPANDVTLTANFTYTSGGGGGGGGETPLPVQPAPSGGEKLEIPANFLANPEAGRTVTLNSNVGSVTIPSNMLMGIPGAEGKKAEIVIGEGNKDDLPGDIKDAIGDRPLISLSLLLDGEQTDWDNPDAPVTVSVPYTPTEEELANPEGIVVWYIDGDGNAVCVPNGRYDPATGRVTFDVTHFSDYAVVYNQVSFKDVAESAWYGRAVSFIAARDITTGTGGGNFSPDAKLTRGQFIVMLMKAYEITPDKAGSDNFSDAGNTYYTNYLAAAKRLGISGGVGNNMFAPNKEITRQEMFTLLYNALKVIGQLPEGTAGKPLSSFSDAGQIASWATDALTLLTQTGTVGGSNGALAPLSTTTRAEMAQVLYNMLGK